MFKGRLEVVKNMLQIIHITIIFMLSTGSVHFRFDIDFFSTFFMPGFFYYFLVLFSRYSGSFLQNRVATLSTMLQDNVMEMSKLLLTGCRFSSVRIPIKYVVVLRGVRLAVL